MKLFSLTSTMLASSLLLAGLTGAPALADDGELIRKSMTPSPGNAPPVPLGHVAEAEHAFIDIMKFYVPGQAANGTVLPLDYINIDGTLVETHNTAKPLVSVYIYGPAESFDDIGFVGHGTREAYGAVSLDDGVTWKASNLSESADQVSSDVCREDIDLFGDCDSGGNYPGDVVNVFQGTGNTAIGLADSAGMNTLAVWPSRFCSAGEPNYSLDTSNPDRRLSIADWMGIDIGEDGTTQTNPSSDDLYLIDMFGVGGSQGFVDYSEDKFEQNQKVGMVPYSCLWAARGKLVMGDDPRTGAVEASYMRWFKAERLTSGVRDVNRVETTCVVGAGCAVTWQEDPEGLRGGQGEGPGVGWSGAVAHSQTDTWYAYLNWEHFDPVQDPADNGVTILTFEDWLASDPPDLTKPQVGIPFSVPMRVTDNAKCNVENPQPYCWGSAEALPEKTEGDLEPLVYGMVDMCADTVEIPTGQSGSLADVCITEYGMPLVGNVASTRPRLGLYGYDSNKDDLVDSAFVVFEAEESKGLGAFGFSDGTPCDPEEDEGCIAFDEGKNLWYYTFNMELTGDADGNFVDKTNLDSLLANTGGHGNQLNQPEVNWETGEFYPVANTADFWDFEEYNFEIWNTEIARRGSLLAQDIGKVNKTKANSGLIALPAWKQGIMNQGGPADTMVRRIISPKNWKVNKDGNPYAFRNMDCSNWLYGRNGGVPENANYPDGLCMDSATNLSGTVPDTCTDSAEGGDVLCPQVDLSQGTTFGVGDTNPILQGNQVEPNQTKVLTWHQCPAEFTTVKSSDGLVVENCDTDLRTDDTTLSDQSWYNPLDVSKGHRGFLDGDFVMMLHAQSPNWRLNAKGNDRYELYIRRSFDGGETWTTLPSNYKHWDNVQYSGAGTVTCETFREEETGSGDPSEPRVCNDYGAGAAEQARNVTQHKSMAITTLDPRYTSTPSSIVFDGTGVASDWNGEDERDPSRYNIVYETGDNTTADVGEPEPLDLFYSRAVMFGDNYQVWAEEDDLSVCFPSDPHDADVPEELIGSEFCNEFDQVDQGTPGLEGSEASLEANPGGEFSYTVWTQFDHDAHESDAVARRVWWIDDYISETEAWKLPGTSGGSQ